MLTAILLLTAALPFAQPWSDTGLISRDDDWSGVAGMVGHRGDGLTSVAGVDPRTVVADGSGTPVDVNANETDPRAVGLAAGVTEFQLPDPVVALQGSATAAAPHLVLSLDTRGHSGVTVRYRLRDVDPSSIANAVQPLALQYRVGANGDFAPVPGGFVADATTGPGHASLVTPVSAVLPAAAGERPLVQLRIITTNAVGQDEWVGVDDIEVEASGWVCRPPWEPPSAGPPPPEPPAVAPPGGPSLHGPSAPPPSASLRSRIAITGLALTPAVFAPARKGPAALAPPGKGPAVFAPAGERPAVFALAGKRPAVFAPAGKSPPVRRRGRAGASLRFRLSRPGTVRFLVTSPRHPGQSRPPGGGTRAIDHGRGRAPLVPRQIGGFSVRGRRGVNRLRFSGRLRGRALPAGPYRLTGHAVDGDGRASARASVEFRIR
jgi:hypothetical protein